MASRFVRVVACSIAIVAGHPAIGVAQGKVASWLDEPKPASWNKPGLPIPAASMTQGPVDSKCRELARPPQLDEDMRVRDQGWDLVGAYQGGWQILVIRGTAGYDGMCRPRQYQDFVFVRGVFAGTLSPQAMDSRADGALTRVSLQSSSRLTAGYERYAASDPLCCPSRTTTVVFDMSNDPPVLRPVSASTTQARGGSASAATNRPLEGTYWRVTDLAGKPTPAQDPKREVHLRGAWKSSGPNQITFGPLALTRQVSGRVAARSDREAVGQHPIVRHQGRSSLSGLDGRRRNLRVRAGNEAEGIAGEHVGTAIRTPILRLKAVTCTKGACASVTHTGRPDLT